MAAALIRKLQTAGVLLDDDRRILESLCTHDHSVEPRQDLTCEGDRPEYVHLVTEGFACRYKTLLEGERQIMALLVPGDLCDLHVALLGEMDHSIATLTECRVVRIPRATILALTETHPRIGRALWWATLVDEAILREWLVNLGRRTADRRIAHLFCELWLRLRTVGLADADGYDMPLRQTDLADILGLTPVHVSRTLHELRDAGLITLRARRLTIPDVDRLTAFCGFNANYLHLRPRA